MSNPMTLGTWSSTGRTVIIFFDNFRAKKTCHPEPFEAESTTLTAAPILSPPTTKMCLDVGTSATTVDTVSDARYSKKHAPRQTWHVLTDAGLEWLGSLAHNSSAGSLVIYIRYSSFYSEADYRGCSSLKKVFLSRSIVRWSIKISTKELLKNIYIDYFVHLHRVT